MALRGVQEPVLSSSTTECCGYPGSSLCYLTSSYSAQWNSKFTRKQEDPVHLQAVSNPCTRQKQQQSWNLEGYEQNNSMTRAHKGLEPPPASSSRDAHLGRQLSSSKNHTASSWSHFCCRVKKCLFFKGLWLFGKTNKVFLVEKLMLLLLVFGVKVSKQLNTSASSGEKAPFQNVLSVSGILYSVSQEKSIMWYSIGQLLTQCFQYLHCVKTSFPLYEFRDIFQPLSVVSFTCLPAVQFSIGEMLKIFNP